MESEPRISRISFTPVKGMRIAALDEAELTRNGIPGDRAFYLVDERRRMVNAKRFGALLSIRPEYDRQAGTLRLHFPGGSVYEGETGTGELQAVTFFGRQTRARPVNGPFSEAVSDFVGHELRLMARPENDAAVDRGPIGAVTLLGAASVDRLETVAVPRSGLGQDPLFPGAGSAVLGPAPIDHRRFRMSVEFEGADPYVEDGWIGAKVRAGEALLRINGHVGRCAVTTRDPESGDRDLPVLDLLKASRGDVVSEEALPFGVYASVATPGRIRLGDPVTLA